MTVFRTIAGAVAVSSLLISAGYAGPCSDDIGRVEVQIAKKLDALAATGPTGAEDATAFGRHLQPTPGTLATAEEKLGDVSRKKVDAVKSAMGRARAADAAGDKSACEQALADVERELGN
jgi:hypothetical protein